MSGFGGRFGAALALAGLVVAGGCAGGGGGSSSGGAASSASGAGGAHAVRMVGFDRRALSPSSAPRVELVVERPAGAASGAFSLEESADGVTFYASGAAPAQVMPAALLYDLPVPPAPRWYRVTAPVPSNRVAVDPAAILASAPPASTAGGATTFLADPPAGSVGVSRRPTLSVTGGPGARSFLFAVADEEGTLAWLAESASPSLAVGAVSGAHTFVAPGASGLPGNADHLAAAVCLDAECFGLAGGAAPRAEFRTAP